MIKEQHLRHEEIFAVREGDRRRERFCSNKIIMDLKLVVVATVMAVCAFHSAGILSYVNFINALLTPSNF